MGTKLLMGVLAILCGLLMNPISAHAEFYKWIDDKGDIHFTDQHANIPEKYLPFAETRQTPIESSPPTIIERSASTLGKQTSELIPMSHKPVAQETSTIFRGVISSIDKAARTIVVAGAVSTMVFPIPQDTRITTDFGKPLLFTDLMREMWVSVEHIQKGEDIQTLSIKTETMASGFEKVERPAEEGKYEGPKYGGPKYQGPKYQGPKYQSPKYPGSKK